MVALSVVSGSRAGRRKASGGECRPSDTRIGIFPGGFGKARMKARSIEGCELLSSNKMAGYVGVWEMEGSGVS